ncbi:MAG: hypothetical protein QOK40_811 [Miltoncostaeaceae bacterium]|jgi:hypothetical protein|nr:hypothetical protein [Miltoncostaeaceae bacterium]
MADAAGTTVQDRLGVEVRRAAVALREAEERVAEARARRDRAIQAAIEAGMGVRQVAREAGITHAAVLKIGPVREARLDRNLRELRERLAQTESPEARLRYATVVARRRGEGRPEEVAAELAPRYDAREAELRQEISRLEARQKEVIAARIAELRDKEAQVKREVKDRADLQFWSRQRAFQKEHGPEYVSSPAYQAEMVALKSAHRVGSPEEVESLSEPLRAEIARLEEIAARLGG